MKNITGLTKNEVRQRINEGKVNYDTTTPSKSIKQILIDNTFTLFNFINLILGLAIILVGSYKNLLFLGVVICNTLISTVQEIRAKKIVDKLSVISSSKAKVIRDGKRRHININDIVLDDVITYNLGDQIITDSVIIFGECEVNESFITGESKTRFKKAGDHILSGSFIVSGNVITKVEHVGIDNYTSVISRDATKRAKEVNSEIMHSLNKIVKYVSIALIPIGILLLLRQLSIDGNNTTHAVVTVVAAVVGMIPEGLILLVSTVLAVSVLRLSKYNVLVQDLYAIETLARVDTLCLDKTGTITEGIMEVSDIIPLNNCSINDIDIALEAITSNLEDKNPTFNALFDKYGNDSKLEANRKIPFSSERKYSGIVLPDKSFIIGAPEFILNDEVKLYDKVIDKYSQNARVLMLIKTDVMLENNLPSKKKVMALILIKDKVRKEACATLKYFMENDVDIKIISGDNPKTVSYVAKEVGINVKGVYNAKNINSDTDLYDVVSNNTIFGRVKPEQKRMFISALRNKGHVVAMTGDGVNDVLALKESDCAIAMNSGSDAARNVSELILLDSNFDSIPKIVKEGRRTINNLERSATLFLSKTIYASLLAVLFLFINYAYPFVPIQMTLINSLTIGIPAFILALEPNLERVKGRFLINVVSKAIPSGITTVINILLLVFLASIFDLPNNMTSTMAVIITSYTAILLIYRISKPLNFLRKSLILGLTLLFISVIIIVPLRNLYSLSLLNTKSLLVLLPLMYLSTRLFKLFSNILNIVIEKKKNWFI